MKFCLVSVLSGGCKQEAKYVCLFADRRHSARKLNNIRCDFNIFPLWRPCVRGLRRGGAALEPEWRKQRRDDLSSWMVTSQTCDHWRTESRVAVGTLAPVLNSGGKWLCGRLEPLMETLSASEMTLVDINWLLKCHCSTKKGFNKSKLDVYLFLFSNTTQLCSVVVTQTLQWRLTRQWTR